MVHKASDKDFEVGSNVKYRRPRDNMSHQDQLNDSNYLSGVRSYKNSEHSQDVHEYSEHKGK